MYSFWLNGKNNFYKLNWVDPVWFSDSSTVSAHGKMVQLCCNTEEELLVLFCLYCFCVFITCQHGLMIFTNILCRYHVCMISVRGMDLRKTVQRLTWLNWHTAGPSYWVFGRTEFYLHRIYWRMWRENYFGHMVTSARSLVDDRGPGREDGEAASGSVYVRPLSDLCPLSYCVTPAPSDTNWRNCVLMLWHARSIVFSARLG